MGLEKKNSRESFIQNKLTKRKSCSKMRYLTMKKVKAYVIH